MKAQRGRKRDGPNRRSSECGLKSHSYWPGLQDPENPPKGIGQEMEYLDDLIEDDVKMLTPKDHAGSHKPKL
jgi:hypothetical protein